MTEPIEQALRESERKYRELVENANSIILHWTRDGRVTFLNEFGQRFFGYSAEEIIGRHVIGSIVPMVDSVGSDLRQLMDRICADPTAFEQNVNENVRRNGEHVWIAWTNKILRDSRGEVAGILSIGTDITERKRADESLLASRNLLQSVVENVPIRVFWKDAELRFLGCNTAFARDAGLPRPEDLLGKDDFQMGWREEAELYRADDRQVMESGIAKLGIEEPQTTPEGRTNWIRTSKVPLRDAKGQVFGLLGIYEDITERRQARLELQRTNRALRAISACNEVLIHATDESRLLDDMCQLIVKNAGYMLTWIGFAEDDERKTVRPVAHGGYEQDYVERTQVTWADEERGRGPAGAAIRTRLPAVVKDTLTDPAYLPWRDHSVKLGYRSVLALPLVSFGQVLGALSIYSPAADGFAEEEVKLLDQLSDDLAFGIVTLRTRQSQELSAQRLLRSMEASITAIAATVEMRDPYTAGHQRRVAELSKAIAGELGLPDEDIHGLYLAAVIHDLGKIQVPAEILSKPGKLMAPEFQIIQSHPQAGYDILKGIDFPWPIAQIIYQHHERLDGSGYPNGLKDAQILLEAKILSVADVVEAMSSHRPYRPGLGIEAALDEITHYREVRYDGKVVDACIRLFRERGYSLPVAGA
ncbi:MAG: PAS domain S-box protein [Nevskia sp.]|nr:PAS domain S-box protein [Nevskia sp.]